VRGQASRILFTDLDFAARPVHRVKDDAALRLPAKPEREAEGPLLDALKAGIDDAHGLQE
jgi:hypothetical protein